MAKRKSSPRGTKKGKKGSPLYSLTFLLMLAGGLMLISNKAAEARRSKATYDQQQQSIAAGKAQEEELQEDKKKIENPALFEEIARKHGYRMEDETVVNVTRPITEEDKWK